MITRVRVRGLGVLDDVEVEFGPGFNVITGESGAGKTMILRGIYLLLGAKPDPGLVREGHERIEVEGAFRLDHPRVRDRIAERLADAGIEIGEDDELIIARTVAREGGRSRAVVHGRSVPVSMLAELAADLAVVHGQGDQVRLLQPTRQRGALDRFAGDAVEGLLGAYREGWARLQAVDRELEELVANARERAREADLLRFGVAEIEEVDPQPGEDSELAFESSRLSHAETLRELAGAAHEALSAERDDLGSDALSLLGSAEAAAAKAAGIDPALEPLVARLREVRLLAEDVAGELAAYASGVEADPARLAVVEERRAALGGLKRKYGESLEEVLDWLTQASARLTTLDSDEDNLGALRAERAELLERLLTWAGEISAVRTVMAERLGAAVTAELTELAMPNARVVVQVSAAQALGPYGIDDVEFLLASHAEAPLRPIAKAASGGELSRTMLALEVALVGTMPVPTMLFDEVDAGVGGDAARALAARLARVAQASQLIVVTHLAQVAAEAGRHLALLSSKREADAMRAVAGEERVEEVARMLAGDGQKEAARRHAREILG